MKHAFPVLVKLKTYNIIIQYVHCTVCVLVYYNFTLHTVIYYFVFIYVHYTLYTCIGQYFIICDHFYHFLEIIFFALGFV